MVENIHMDSKMRALALKKAIEKACIAHGLNLTIYDGRIGFVDQEEGKIVMLWGARYNIDDLYDAYEIQAPEEGGNGNA